MTIFLSHDGKKTEIFDAQRASSALERDQRDFWAGTEAHRRPPAARAGADIDPHGALARESRDVRRVNEAYGERPRKELPGVRVPRELEVETRVRPERCELRIVREQQAEIGARRILERNLR